MPIVALTSTIIPLRLINNVVNFGPVTPEILLLIFMGVCAHGQNTLWASF